jgi:hypothetical protein
MRLLGSVLFYLIIQAYARQDLDKISDSSLMHPAATS